MNRRSQARAVRALIVEQRRVTLRTRTISVTLVSALDDYARQTAAAQPDDEAQLHLRRLWCERALQMLQDVRASSMRAREVARTVAAAIDARGDVVDLSELEDASREADVSVERAEKTAQEWLRLVS